MTKAQKELVDILRKSAEYANGIADRKPCELNADLLEAAIDFAGAPYMRRDLFDAARFSIPRRLQKPFEGLQAAIEKYHTQLKSGVCEEENARLLADSLTRMADCIEQLDDSSRRHEESNAAIAVKLDTAIENQNTLVKTVKSGIKSLDNQIKLARSDHEEQGRKLDAIGRNTAEVKADTATIAATMPDAEQWQEIFKAINAGKHPDKRVTNSQASRILQIIFSHDDRFKRVTERTISNWIRAGIVPKANGYPISKADFASLSTFLHWASQLATHESIVPQFTQPNLKQINALFSEK